MNEPAEPTPRPATAAAFHVRSFDGVRGLAILLVIAYHTVGATAYPDATLRWARPLLMSGWAGVDLFFALSGFLITTLLLREEDRERLAGRPARFSLPRFYLRRALRILPAFFAVFALNVFVFSRLPFVPSAGLDEIHNSKCGLWPYGTFWTNYILAYGPRWLGPAFAPGRGAYAITWSLCVEEHFYLLWPCFLFLCKGLRARVVVSATVCLLLPVLRHLAIGLGWDNPLAVHFASHYRLDSILWGGLTALLARHLSWSHRTRRLSLAVGLAIIVSLVVTRTMSVSPVGKPLGFSLGFSALAVTSALLLLDLSKTPGTRLGRIFALGPLVAVGRVSYGMYLLHLPVMDLGMRVLFAVPRQPTLANLGIAIVFFWSVTFAAAQVLYHVVEKRFLALKDRAFR